MGTFLLTKKGNYIKVTLNNFLTKFEPTKIKGGSVQRVHVNNLMAKENNNANNKKMVEAITSMGEDFAQWYTDVVKKAELIDYSSVEGCLIIKPYGYAIWENIQHELDRRFKETGVENVYMPLFIPESLLEKEKDHVEGFAPKLAWGTQGGLQPLQEKLCVRPTA